MSARGRKLVATEEPTVVSEPFLDTIVMEDGQSNGCFPDSSWTDKSDWNEIFSETNNLLDQFVTSETDPRRRGRGFAGYAERKCEILVLLVTVIADLG